MTAQLPVFRGERVALTEREASICQLLARGASCKEAATSLNIAPGTVEAHRQNAYRKLRVRNRAELTRVMMEAQ